MKKVMLGLVVIAMAVVSVYSAESPIDRGSALFGGTVNYSSQSTEGSKSIKIFSANVKAGSFIFKRFLMGPEIGYINVNDANSYYSSYEYSEVGLFTEYYIGRSDGDKFFKAGVGARCINRDSKHEAMVTNPRIGLEFLFTKKAAIELELGYKQISYSDYNTHTDITYLSIGLIGFGY